MKRTISALIATTILMSATGCGDPATESDQTIQQSIASVTQETADDTAAPLSIPVAMIDGDVDMTKAMEYQTDIDALLASFEA